MPPSLALHAQNMSGVEPKELHMTLRFSAAGALPLRRIAATIPSLHASIGSEPKATDLDMF